MLWDLSVIKRQMSRTHRCTSCRFNRIGHNENCSLHFVSSPNVGRVTRRHIEIKIIQSLTLITRNVSILESDACMVLPLKLMKHVFQYCDIIGTHWPSPKVQVPLLILAVPVLQMWRNENLKKMEQRSPAPCQISAFPQHANLFWFGIHVWNVTGAMPDKRLNLRVIFVIRSVIHSGNE